MDLQEMIIQALKSASKLPASVKDEIVGNFEPNLTGFSVFSTEDIQYCLNNPSETTNRLRQCVKNSDARLKKSLEDSKIKVEDFDRYEDFAAAFKDYLESFTPDKPE